MAEIVKTVRIETGNGERSVKSLKKEISDLRDALLNMDQGGEEWVKTANELTRAQEELNTVMKAGKQAVDADASSIAGMEARYKSLYTTYRLLSDEQRKSAKGLSMQKELAELSKNLNTVKKDAGNFKDNIGHYADDMMSAFSSLGINIGGLQGPFKLASQGAKGFKGALDILAKHPFLTVAVVLIGLFKKINDAIKGNEELQMRMNKVTAAFKPIGDMMANILDKVAGLAVKVAEGIAKVVTWMNNLFGATRRLSEAELALADSENRLIKQRREINELNSNDEARIQELMEQASITDDMVEKERMLTEAKELQEKVNKRNVELAEEELRIIKEKNKITPSSTADLNKESEAQVKVNQARANGERALRRINNQLKSTQKTASNAHNEEKKELEDILKRLDENTKTEVQKITEKYEKEKKLLQKYHKDTTALTEEYNKQILEIERKAQITRQRYYIEARTNIDNYIQPSQAAYTKLINGANRNLNDFKKAVAEALEMTPGNAAADAMLKRAAEKNEFAIDISKLIDKDGLTQAAKDISEIWGVGLEETDDYNTALGKLNYTLGAYTNQLGLARKENKEWKDELKEEKKEIELLKQTYEKNILADLLLKDSDNYAIALGNINKAEGDFLRERATKVKVAYEEIKDLDEKALNAKGLTLNDQLQKEREYYEALEELRQHDLENQMAIREREKELEQQKFDAINELKNQYFDSINSIVDTYKVLLDAYKRDGEMSEKEAKKKANTLKWLEGIQGAAAVAQIVADTASGWMQLNKSQAAEYVLNAETAAATGPAAAATKAALDAKTTLVHGIRKATLIAGGVTAAAAAIGKTIASIKSLDKGSGDEGGSSAAAAPQLIDSTPYSYTRELQTDVEREQVLNTPIYVRVTDIESAQARVRVVENESTY